MKSFFRKRAGSFGHAWKGIAHSLRTQHNLQIHLTLALLATGMGFWLGISATEWCFVVFAIGMVLAAELFNTAIETLVDLVSPERNEKAGKIKDIAAGAVLICAVAALAVGLVVFLPKILEQVF